MTFVSPSSLPSVSTGDLPDRRRRSRLKLAYPVRMRRAGSPLTMEAKTENISSDGFFCLTRQALSLRETLQCEIVIPRAQATDADERDVVLRCRVEVVRVVYRPDELAFGVACRLVA
jgi:hypothetical protein